MQLSVLTAIITVATLALASQNTSTCGTCKPQSDQNKCDQTTSCINTGSTFHCACRAGYKASATNNSTSQQFRLPMDSYNFLVFVPENTACNTLCDNSTAAPSQLCNEVQLNDQCQV